MARTMLILALGLALLGAACASSPAPAAGDPRDSADATVAFWLSRVDNDPHDFVAFGGLGVAYAARARLSGDVADYAAARESLAAAVELGPASADALVQLGLIQAALHEFERALELADEALSLETSHAFAHALRGDALFALARYDDARDAYQQAYRLAPGLGTAARLALFHAYVGDTALADNLWTIALSSSPAVSAADAAWAWTEAGRFSLGRGNIASAQERVAAALKRVRGYVPARALEADLMTVRGDIAGAIAIYEAIVVERPAVEYVVALGELYAAAGDASAAARQYEVVAGIDRLYLAAGVNTDLAMARFHVFHGDPARALDLAQRSYAARPTADAADALALALAANGRPSDGLEFAGKALQTAPGNALFHVHAASIAFAAGADDLARTYLSEAMTLNPHLPLATLPAAVTASIIANAPEVLG